MPLLCAFVVLFCVCINLFCVLVDLICVSTSHVGTSLVSLYLTSMCLSLPHIYVSLSTSHLMSLSLACWYINVSLPNISCVSLSLTSDVSLPNMLVYLLCVSIVFIVFIAGKSRINFYLTSDVSQSHIQDNSCVCVGKSLMCL